MVSEKVLTDAQKIVLLQNSRKLSKKWKKLVSREQKLQILKGMEIATDEKWILGLFDELEDD